MKNTKKIAIAIAVVVIVIASIGAGFAIDTMNNRKSFEFLELEYTRNGQRVRENVNTGIIGKTLQLSCDKNTSVSMWFYVSEFGGNSEFNLQEVLVTSLEESILFEEIPSLKKYDARSEYQKDMGITCFSMASGESAIVTIDCGKEASPKWVSFKLETIAAN